MKPTKTLILLLTRMIAVFVLMIAFAPKGFCGSNGPGGDNSGDGTQPQQNEGSLPDTEYKHDLNTGQYYDWYYKNKMIFTKPMTNPDPSSSGSSSTSGGLTAAGAGSSSSGSGSSSNSSPTKPRELIRPGPDYDFLANKWPIPAEGHYKFPVVRDALDYNTDPIDWQEAAYYPVSHRGYYLERMVDSQRTIERLTAPEQWLHVAQSMAQWSANNLANGTAAVGINQDQNAIGFVQQYLLNFPNDQGSPFQALLKQLFYPMAILLLLPGAVLAQGRAIVAQGSPILGEISPFEGLYRSLVAIFLIPGSFLVMSYGIDVSNSITFSIADEYKKLGLGQDMYQDAQKLVQRGLAVNPMQRDDNYIPPANQASTQTPSGQNSGTPEGQFEDRSTLMRRYIPGQVDQTVTADEEAPAEKNFNRIAMNSANAGLAMTWNIMCAFQMAFLYYLWCMGPIAAALWVWPMERLRAAFPSWVEGVVTLCFWSLFWNTVVLLMACFRNVGESGTVILTALNGLATLCVQYAFDFSSLISQGAASQLAGAVQSSMKGATGGGGQQQGGGARGANGGAMAHAPGGAQGGYAAGGFAGGGGGIPGLPGMGGRLPMSAGSGAETFNSGVGVGGNSAVGRGGLSLGGPFSPTSTSAGSGLWTGGAGGDGGLPAFLRNTPLADLSPQNAAAALSLLANNGRGGNMDALAAEMRNNPELAAWLSQVHGNGAFDPNNPTAGNLLHDYLSQHPNDATANGFADFVAAHSLGTPLGEALAGVHDLDSRAALAQFLSENPNISLNDPNLANFLSENQKFTIGDLNSHIPTDQSLVSFANDGPPLVGNYTHDLTSFSPYFNQDGNLVTPNNLMGETGFHPGMTNPLDGGKGLEFVQFDANNVPHTINIDPSNPNAFHDIHNMQGVNPNLPIYAMDPVTHQPIAAFNPSDPSQGWVGGGGHIHYDPQTGLGTVDGVNGSFAYNMQSHQWDMAGSNHAVSVDPSSGQLTMSGTHIPVEQVGGQGQAPPYLQADMGNGHHLQSFDNGAHWVSAGEGGQTAPGPQSQTFEWNSQAGAFSLSGSQGNVLFDGSGMHVGPYQVVETGVGQNGHPNLSVDVGGNIFTSNDNGAHWVQQGISEVSGGTGGGMGHSIEWNREAGSFVPIGSSGGIVYDNSGMHIGPYQVHESGFGQGSSPAYSVDVGGRVFNSYDGGSHWVAQGGQTMEWSSSRGGFVPESSHGQLVYTDQGLVLPNSNYHVFESGGGTGTLPTYTADLGGHVLTSTDGGATWTVPGGGGGTYEWNQGASGFTPTGLGSHSGVVVDASGAHIPGSSAPVSVFADQSGNTIFATQWQGANVTSTDGGVTWNGSGVLANSHFEFRGGELVQLPGGGDNVTFNPVQSVSEFGRASTVVGHDSEPTVTVTGSSGSLYTDPGSSTLVNVSNNPYYDAGSNTISVGNSSNNLYYDTGSGSTVSVSSFTDGGSIPFSYHLENNGINVVDNTGGQVAYNPDNQSMFIPGTNVSVTRDADGTYFANSGQLERPVWLDHGQWMTEAGGTAIPVRVDQAGSGWIADQNTAFVAPTSEYPQVLPEPNHPVRLDSYSPYGQVEDLMTSYPLGGNEGRTIAFDGGSHPDHPSFVENQGTAALFVGDTRRNESTIVPDSPFHPPAEPVIVPIVMPASAPNNLPPPRGGLADIVGRIGSKQPTPAPVEQVDHSSGGSEDHSRGSLQDQLLAGNQRGGRKAAREDRRRAAIEYLTSNGIPITEENIDRLLG